MTERLERNDESRNRADNHREIWSANEDEFLQVLWDGTDDGLTEVAEILGRTREACRERYYKVRRGETGNYGYTRRTTTTTTTTTIIRPAWMDEEGLPDWYT